MENESYCDLLSGYTYNLWMNMDTLRLINYRCFEDTGTVELKPLTLLVGANSSGKSSFLKFFPLLKQSMDIQRNGVFLWLSNNVDFQDFRNTVRNGTGSIGVSFLVKDLNISSNKRLLPKKIKSVIIEIKVSEKDAIFDYLEELRIAFDDQEILVMFSKNNDAEVIINGSKVQFGKEKVKSIGTNSLLPRLVFINDKGFDDEHSINSYEFLQNTFVAKESLEYADITRFRRFMFAPNIGSRKDLISYIKRMGKGTHLNWDTLDKELINNQYLYYNVNNIIDSININVMNLAQNIVYIRPLRATTERYYRFQNYSVEEIDSDGKNLAMFLYNLDVELKEEFRSWTNELLGFKLDVVANNGHIELKIAESDNIYRNMVDIGFGYTQLLPIIAIIWKTIFIDTERERRRKNSKHEFLVVIEQPELHLHHRFQAKFAELLVRVIKWCEETNKDIRFIIETHSEVILNKIGESVAMDKINKNDVSVVLFNAQKEDMARYVELATYSKDGFLTNWPMGFFAEYVD